MGIMIEFIIYASNFPIEEVYEYIGIEGNKKILDKREFATLGDEYYIRDEESSITYTTGSIDTIDLNDVVNKIFDIIHPKENEIIDCINKYQLQTMFCVVLNLPDNPIISLSREFVDMASRLRASIDFDSYVINE